jgi:hypothetical protein
MERKLIRLSGHWPLRDDRRASDDLVLAVILPARDLGPRELEGLSPDEPGRTPRELDGLPPVPDDPGRFLAPECLEPEDPGRPLIPGTVPAAAVVVPTTGSN